MHFSMGKNIKRYRLKCGYTQAELGQLLNKGESTVSMWESGAREPKMKTLEQIAHVLKVDTSSLISGTHNVVTSSVSEISEIPVYGFTAAGTPIEALQDIQRMIEVPSTLIERYGKDKLVALKVAGDSMNKIIPDGSIAIIARDLPISNGDIGVVYYDGFNATLKTIYTTSENIILEPASYNEDNKPLVINKTNKQNVQMFGKLVYWCGDFN